jgi:purine nucleosidase
MEFHLACFGYAGCSICDPAALALAFMPELARTQPMHIAVEYTSELTAGKSVLSYVGDSLREPDFHDQLGYDAGRWPMQWGHMIRTPPNARAVIEFDNQRFIALFVERMEQLARRRLSRRSD